MSENEHAGAEDLIAALRTEIEELDRDVEHLDDEPEVTLPEGLRGLLATVVVSPKIAAAVDEIVANVDPIPNSLADALRAQAREARDVLGGGYVFLEQKVSLARTRKSITVDQLAGAVGVEADVIQAVERGKSTFDHLDAEAVAKWIEALELDITDAVQALDRSLRSPAMSYAGDPDEYGRKANEFVEKVKRLLEGQPDKT